MRNREPRAEPIAKAKRLMEEILLPLPRLWLFVVGTAVLLSLVQVERSSKDWKVTVEIGADTAVLLALVWLPFVLKLIALTGGGLKAPGGEATTQGLVDLVLRLSPDTQRELLPTIIGVVDTVEDVALEAEREELRVMKQELESRLASLSEIGDLYQTTRREMQPGAKRTFELIKIVAAARTLVQHAEFEPTEVSNLFTEDTEGSRITALAILQAKPDRVYFPLVLEAIAKSRSAFEQYEALRAAEHMLPILEKKDKRELKSTLLDQRSGREGAYIKRGSDRWSLSGRILNSLGEG